MDIATGSDSGRIRPVTESRTSVSSVDAEDRPDVDLDPCVGSGALKEADEVLGTGGAPPTAESPADGIPSPDQISRRPIVASPAASPARTRLPRSVADDLSTGFDPPGPRSDGFRQRARVARHRPLR
jgi:hypothetical protein